ncbi:hypothetical protein ACFSTC_38005 [Nonomuraea ferruginea]
MHALGELAAYNMIPPGRRERHGASAGPSRRLHPPTRPPAPADRRHRHRPRTSYPPDQPCRPPTRRGIRLGWPLCRTLLPNITTLTNHASATTAHLLNQTGLFL